MVAVHNIGLDHQPKPPRISRDNDVHDPRANGTGADEGVSPCEKRRRDTGRFGLFAGRRPRALVLPGSSELYGRATIFHATNLFFLLWAIATALSDSLGMLIACRFFLGVSAAASQSVFGGVLSDIFIPTEQAKPFGIISTGMIAGALLGPIFGGCLTSWKGWRASCWFIATLATINQNYRLTVSLMMARDSLKNPADLFCSDGGRKFATLSRRRAKTEVRQTRNHRVSSILSSVRSNYLSFHQWSFSQVSS